MVKNYREITSLSEEEDRESGPPGFKSRMDKSSEESSLETAIHVSDETSSSEEEVNGFSSSRARLVREKLGITVLGKENADKAFAEFCRNRQKEIENIRKKSVVPDVTINLKKQVGKKGYHTRRIVEGGKKKGYMECSWGVFEMLERIWVPLAHQVGYVKNFKQNVEKLRDAVEELYRRRNDVKREVERARMAGKIPSSECEGWLKMVEKIQDQVNGLEEELREEDDKKCLRISWLPSCNSRLKLGKRIVKTTKAVVDLKEKGLFVGGIVIDPPPKVVQNMPGPRIKAETATDRTLHSILEYLRDADVGRIGIWGMGGVGKTTIMKNLNNRPELAKMFEIIIWFTVSRDWTMRYVQNEIANRLSLDLLIDASDDNVASRLYAILEKRKFLLLLDDVWENIDLDKVGVPSPNKENGSKLILTTRSLGVCHKMGTDKEIKVKVLCEEESWKLFHEKVGEVANSPSIKSIARDVVKKCGGLPLAIIVVGAALRKEEDVEVWKNARRELRSPSLSMIEDLEEQVFKRLKFSYDRLKSDNIKECFLYCSLFREDQAIGIDELIEYWWAEGFIDGVENSEEARQKGYAISKVLKDACMLEGGSPFTWVKMHDMMRDLALRITYGKGDACRFLVKAGLGLKEAPKEEEWRGVKRISLLENQITSLPDRPYCPELSTVLLQYNGNMKMIPNAFFEHMHNLRVLDMSMTGIQSLPASLTKLINLQALYLRDCDDLRIIPANFSALKRLEVLVLNGHSILDLSLNTIGELTSLRRLNISSPHGNLLDVFRRCRIPYGMISKLQLLEELTVGLVEWWDENGEGTVEEIGSLKHLTFLDFNFPKVEWLHNFLRRNHSWNNRFHFVVGYYTKDDFHGQEIFGLSGSRRHLEFLNGDGVPTAVSVVLNHTEVFCLFGHRSVREVSEFVLDNMKGLKRCLVQKCNRIESLIDGNKIEAAALPNLEDLFLKNLINMRIIWKGLVPCGSLSSLRHFHVELCPKLRQIFSSRLLQQLVNLEHLTVNGCEEVEAIIGEEEHIMEDTILPKLQKISLRSVPKLKSICKQVLAWPSLQELKINGCPSLKNLPPGIHNSKTLKIIQGKQEWWEALVWEDDVAKYKLQPLFQP